MNTAKINIAIDGFSSCGKSTLAKDLAKELSYVFIDSGAMYRAVTLYAIQNNFFDENEVLNEDKLIQSLSSIEITFQYDSLLQKSNTYLNGENVEVEIRQPAVASKVSRVSQLVEVRRKLVALQQEMGKSKGVVMDGRDIGTVVFPNAELKLFVTAEPAIRTERRYAELVLKNPDITKEEVHQNLQERDYNDTHRENDPLRQAEDAILIDNTDLNKEEQLKLVLELVKKTAGQL